MALTIWEISLTRLIQLDILLSSRGTRDMLCPRCQTENPDAQKFCGQVRGFEKSYSERDPIFAMTFTGPWYDSLSRDKRYAALLKKMGLRNYQEFIE